METFKNISTKNAKRPKASLDIKSISNGLTNRQKEVVKLLQNKEVLLTDNKNKVFVTCGNGNTKKVTPHLFYNLVNKGIVHHQNEWPYNYVLSETGKIIKV